MRRRLTLVCLTVIVAMVAACDASMPVTGRPLGLLAADPSFRCGFRWVDGDAAPDRPDGVRVALDRTAFSCRFAGSYDCVLWVSAINGKQEFWITARGPERTRLVVALGTDLVWDEALIAGLTTTGDAGGRLGAAEWYLGFGGALVVNIDDPSPVT